MASRRNLWFGLVWLVGWLVVSNSSNGKFSEHVREFKCKMAQRRGTWFIPKAFHLMTTDLNAARDGGDPSCLPSGL